MGNRLSLADEALRRPTKEMEAAGMPRDQIRSFLAMGYTPLPWAWQFHAAARAADGASYPPLIDAGAPRERASGSTYAILAQLLLDDCRRMRGVRALVVDEVASFERAALALLGKAGIRHDYQRRRGVLRLPDWNDSTLYLARPNQGLEVMLAGVSYGLAVVPSSLRLMDLWPLQHALAVRGSSPWRARAYMDWRAR